MDFKICPLFSSFLFYILLQVLKFQVFSLTSIPPCEQKLLAEDEDSVINESSDLEAISENLRLVSIQEAEEEKPESIEQFEKSDEELAWILQICNWAEEEAMFLQQFRASEDRGEYEQRVWPYVKQVLMYEDQIRQEAACKSDRVNELEEKLLVSLAKEGKFKPSKEEEDDAFLLQLLFWFKQSFRLLLVIWTSYRGSLVFYGHTITKVRTKSPHPRDN